MNRRQIAFIILFNAIISLVIALAVAWAVEARRPDLEELAAIYTPMAQTGSQPAESAPTNTPVPPVAEVAVTDTPSTGSEVPTATPRDFGETELYIVQTGDSLSSIADRFRVPINDLVEVNNLPNPDFVFVGQRLQIPTAGAAGDTGSTATDNSEAATPAPVTSGILLSALEAPGDLRNEAIQIVNDSDTAINLSGWTLESEGGPGYTFGNVPLFPGNYIWLHSSNGDNTSIAIYWNREDAAWASGNTLRLRNPQGTQVASLVVP